MSVMLVSAPGDRIDTSWRKVVAAISQAAVRKGAPPVGFLGAVSYAQANLPTAWTSVASLFDRWGSRGPATASDATQYDLDATAAVTLLALA